MTMILAASICFGSPRVVRKSMSFEATAYAVRGETAAGTRSKVGTVAADPRVLPLGTRIHVSAPGSGYTGTYTVADTGPAVKGRRIDIRMPSQAAAKKFGRQRVTVRILHRGEGKDDPRLGPKVASATAK
jgi:3D (Asp-Asp-Asp) domain-containing protein